MKNAHVLDGLNIYRRHLNKLMAASAAWFCGAALA